MSPRFPKPLAAAAVACAGLAGSFLACGPVEESRRLDLQPRVEEAGTVSRVSSERTAPREETAAPESEETETDTAGR